MNCATTILSRLFPVSTTRASLSAEAALVPISRGGGRACYAHPHDVHLCIKVPIAERGLKESRREQRYVRLVEKLYGAEQGRHLPYFFGRIDTPLGAGWLIERICDETTDRPSPTLVESLTSDTYARDPDVWRGAYDEFMSWCASTAIVVRDLSPSNLCARRLADGRLRLVLIDGIGPSGAVARCLPTRAYARRRNERYAKAKGVTSLERLLFLSRKARGR